MQVWEVQFACERITPTTDNPGSWYNKLEFPGPWQLLAETVALANHC